MRRATSCDAYASGRDAGRREQGVRAIQNSAAQRVDRLAKVIDVRERISRDDDIDRARVRECAMLMC
jgi:hypothetical protein